MARSRRLEDLTRQLVQRSPLKAKSLIVTIYGDAILPHGGSVWLGSLIELVKPFGVNERLVRTAVLRLSRDGWLSSTRIGRRSYYSLTESGRRRFDDAYRRIYAGPRGAWDGAWHMIFIGLETMSVERREQVRRELGWLGFGQIAPGMLVHPTADLEATRHVLQDNGAIDKVVTMRATGEGTASMGPLAETVAHCWDLDRLNHDYRGFLDTFRPLWRAVEEETALAPDFCFQVRTLLTHEYRRVLLRDPQLPDELLPAGWPGTAARALCHNLYRTAYHPAERHLMAMLETAEGPLPAAAPHFADRFGGIEDEPPVSESVDRRRAS